MYLKLWLFSFGLYFGFATNAFSQENTHQPYQPKPRITLLIPLYLDSAFDHGKYRFGNTMPGFIANSLDFYNGAKIAAHELEAQGIAAKIQVIDTRSPNFLNQYFRDTATEGTGIVISAAQSAAEIKAIAEKLRPLGIPLISMLPNDAGIGGYPEMMLANSTLKTHCEQIFRFLQRNHSIDNLVMLTPNGTAEGRLKNYFLDENKSTPSIPLKWKDRVFTDSLRAESLALMLDSNAMNVVICPTLNANQAQRLVKMLSSLGPKYRTAVFGMPTWETISFQKSEFKGVDVWYGTPFISTSGNADLTEDFSKRFKELTNAKPGDMGFRGYEITFRYLKTYLSHKADFLDHINDRQFRMFNDFDFKPVSLRDNGYTDYLENKKIYMVKKTDGAIKSVMSP
jgi:hypothetical protein